jgi:hypothetical protein
LGCGRARIDEGAEAEGGEAMMRLVAFVVFWAGVFMLVRECLFARKHRLAITRVEKLYLAMVLPIIFCVQLALDSLGVPRGAAPVGAVIAMGLAFSAWAVRRRSRRTKDRSRGLSKA